MAQRGRLYPESDQLDAKATPRVLAVSTEQRQGRVAAAPPGDGAECRQVDLSRLEVTS